MTSQEAKELVIKAHCSGCGGERNCDVLGRHSQGGGDEDFHWHTKWYLLRCRGCEYVFAQTVSTDSESIDYSYGPENETVTEHIETVETWPARIKRPRPDWFDGPGVNLALLTRFSPILREIYSALDNDLHVLAAMGMRMGFDLAASMLDVDPELTFKEKLEQLFEDEAERARLDTLVEAGNASTHRAWRPTSEHLGTMMDVLESFVHDNFVAPGRRKRLDARLADLRSSVPARAPRRRKALIDASDLPAADSTDGSATLPRN
ncbi:DUF4145 domain-containing protein [Mesorhizobium sp.]|uniref:DUF4145 domain-containing protein n=1 Tax=Mesorhizobium sp. TaxID=1871066 RepID=UPI000FEA57B5|nr:DUF4145 domain-containing protein [Mesorhizobium sp.]RWN59727.1 MAG: hypothetical protein EOS00_17295 [Mesorhizobium sp.]